VADGTFDRAHVTLAPSATTDTWCTLLPFLDIPVNYNDCKEKTAATAHG